MFLPRKQIALGELNVLSLRNPSLLPGFPYHAEQINPTTYLVLQKCPQ